MKNKEILYSDSSLKVIIFLFLLIIFLELCGSEYLVPNKPASVDVEDIDQDEDFDIILGHEHHHGNYWGMISILENNGNGEFVLLDTISTRHYEISIQVDQLNNNFFPDIVTLDYDDNVDLPYFNIICDYDLYSWYNTNPCYFNLITLSQFEMFHTQNTANISFISNTGFLWGVLYNNGDGDFSDPEYFDLDYPPNGLACDDLNGDDREDILISGGGNLDVWYNNLTGLQYINITDSAYVSEIEIADIDNDNDKDIISSRWGIPGTYKLLMIYSNEGEGNFCLSYEKIIDEALAEMCVSDLNNDEFPDVVYNVSYSYPNSDYELFHTYILFNNQDGTFQDPVNYYTGICSHKSFIADLDDNGWDDIITLNTDFYNPPPDTGSIHILFNDGTGDFVEEPQVICDECKIEKVKCKINNYPNPFNPVTTIKFYIDQEGSVRINIYDIKGRLIRNLFSQDIKGGEYRVIWDGKNMDNRYCSSGIYLMKLEFNGKIKDTGKLILLK